MRLSLYTTVSVIAAFSGMTAVATQLSAENTTEVEFDPDFTGTPCLGCPISPMVNKKM